MHLINTHINLCIVCQHEVENLTQHVQLIYGNVYVREPPLNSLSKINHYAYQYQPTDNLCLQSQDPQSNIVNKISTF